MCHLSLAMMLFLGALSELQDLSFHTACQLWKNHVKNTWFCESKFIWKIYYTLANFSSFLLILIKYYSSLSLGELLRRCSVWILTLTMGCFSQTLTQPPVRSIGVTSAPILNTHLVEHQVENVLAPILSFIPFHLAKCSFPRAWAGLSHRVLSKNSRSTPG